MSFSGEGDFLEFIRKCQETDQEKATALLEKAEALLQEEDVEKAEGDAPTEEEGVEKAAEEEAEDTPPEEGVEKEEEAPVEEGAVEKDETNAPAEEEADVEKASPWVAATQGKFGDGISVHRSTNGKGYWVTRGANIAGWVEKRGRKWLSRPVGRDEWTGDTFTSAVNYIVNPKIKDDTNPPPGV